MSIFLDVSRFDGKSLAVLKSIKAARACTPELLDALVEMVGDEDGNMQMGTTWLLREYLKEGTELSTDQMERLAGLLPSTTASFAQLHICQMMSDLEVPERHSESFAAFFRTCTGSTNTFLRAWAPDGFWRLATQHLRFEPEARELVENALTDIAPSVRARARKTLVGE